MKWKAKFTRPNYEDGTVRLKRCFAWLPVYIDGFFVWLTNYDIMQVYVSEDNKAIIDGENSIVTSKYWKNKGKRCK